jgi:hypothetical protein
VKCRPAWLSGVTALGALLFSVAAQAALCNPGEFPGDCTLRLARARCTRAPSASGCLAKEVAALLPQVLDAMAERSKTALGRGVAAAAVAREIIAHGLARARGKTNLVSHSRWTGKFCTKDAYHSRARQDIGYDGLANFGVVKPGVLYRGSAPFLDGQPDPRGKRGNGFDTLKKLGIKCRILLRSSTFTDEFLDERPELEKRGIKLFHLPVPTLAYGPPAEELAGHRIPDRAREAYTQALTRARDEFMKIVTSGKHGPCYVSCQSGKDRVGVLVGWYRAVVQGWKPEKIFEEMDDCKFEPEGHYWYYRRLFCRWYQEKFGRDPACAKVPPSP